MDVVEAGTERRPLRAGWLVTAGLVLAVLAAFGAREGLESPRGTASRPPATPAPTRPGALVVTGAARTAPPLAPEDALELLLVGDGAVTSVDTSADDDARVLADGEEGAAPTSFVALRDGFAVLLTSEEGGGGGTLIVRNGREETRTPFDGYLAPGASDTEFWSVAWRYNVAQRRAADGAPLGPGVRVRRDARVLRGVVGGGLLLEDRSGGLTVWDPATRRKVRDVPVGGFLLATGPAHVVSGGDCASELCPIAVADVRHGEDQIPSAWAVPRTNGEIRGAALDPAGRRLAFGWHVVGASTTNVYLGEPGREHPRLAVGGLAGEVRLEWAAPTRLVIVQVADGQLVVLVLDTESGRLRQAGVYPGQELFAFAARPRGAA